MDIFKGVKAHSYQRREGERHTIHSCFCAGTLWLGGVMMIVVY